jgi:hypothetical protein
MLDAIFYREFTETCADGYDWIDIWLKDGYTKESMLEAFKEMIEEVDETVEEGNIK